MPVLESSSDLNVFSNNCLYLLRFSVLLSSSTGFQTQDFKNHIHRNLISYYFKRIKIIWFKFSQKICVLFVNKLKCVNTIYLRQTAQELVNSVLYSHISYTVCCIIPVSYTHLDVYKRQCYSCMNKSNNCENNDKTGTI